MYKHETENVEVISCASHFKILLSEYIVHIN